LEDINNYLKESFFFDYTHESIKHIVKDLINVKISKKEKALKLYYIVRDGWRYNPSRISFVAEDLKASVIAKKEEGHCIDKSIIYISCLRALNIPARIGMAKIKNHIGTEKLEEKFGTNILTPHGYVEVFLNNKWIKATPAFNKELCAYYNVSALDFDGENDSIFQEYSKSNEKFMEYIEDYGTFEDFPVEFVKRNMRQYYPSIFDDDSVVYKF